MKGGITGQRGGKSNWDRWDTGKTSIPGKGMVRVPGGKGAGEGSAESDDEPRVTTSRE